MSTLHAADHGKHTFISRDFMRGTFGFKSGGWEVELHALPGQTFIADAANADEAQAMALHVTKKLRARKGVTLTGATVQAR